MKFFSFINDTFLKMTWLNELFGYILSSFGIDIESPIGASIQFFLFDPIKIFLLFSFLIFAVS